MRVINIISAIVVYCTLMIYVSADCQDVTIGGISTPEDGVSFILIREPNGGSAMPMTYDSDNYLDSLMKIITFLCWDIYICSGISRSPLLRARFAVMCIARVEYSLGTAATEEEALDLVEDGLNYWTRLSRSDVDPDVWYEEERAKMPGWI